MSEEDAASIELSVEKRILLHLHKYSKAFSDAWEVPNAMTQEGMSEALDILLNNVSRAIKDLKTEGKVMERLAHIKGGKRKRRAYFLTDEGLRLAEGIRSAVMDSEVPCVDKDGQVDKLQVSKLLGQFRLDFGETLAPTDIFETVRRNGIFDSPKVAMSLKAESAADAGGREARLALVDMTGAGPRIARFVGRTGILAQFGACIDGEGPRILVIHGMAGIGKTTLAMKVLDDQRGKRNLFYYRFHSWDTLGNLTAALQDLFVGIGVRTKAVGAMRGLDVNGLALLVARELGQRPVILVFDDFHKARDDIVPLFRLLADLAGQLTDMRVILVTRTVPGFYSRKEVSVNGVVGEYQLDGLDLEETRELLGEAVGEKVVERLHGLSRGVPLFLEILSGVGNVDAIADMRKYLEEEVYSGLRQGERVVLEGLSVHRYPVPPEAVLADEATFDDLSMLTKRSLVMELPHRRYDAHDMIKEFVYGRLSPEVKARFHSRAAEFYMAPGPEDVEPEEKAAEGMYYTPELAMLEAVHHMKRSGNVKGAATLLLKEGPDILGSGHLEVRELLESFDRTGLDDGIWSDMLVQRGDAAASAEDWPRALELYKDALAAKRKVVAEKSTLAMLHSMIGTAQMHVEQWEETVNSHENALRMFEEAGDKRGMAKELMQLGMVYRNRKDWKRAEGLYGRAKKLLMALDDDQGLVVLHNNMAMLDMAKGDIRSAENELAEALEVAKDEKGRAVILYTRGDIRWEVGRQDEGRKDLEEAAEILRRTKDYDSAIRVHLRLGDAFLEADRLDDSRRSFMRAVDLFQFKRGSERSFFSRKKRPEDLGTLAAIYDRLSAVARADGELKEAVSYDLKSLDCYEAEGDRTAMARKLLDAGRGCEDVGELRSAKADFERALSVISDGGDQKGVAAVRMNLARVHEGLGDIAAARLNLEKARDIGRRTGDRDLEGIAEKELRRISTGKRDLTQGPTKGRP